MVAEAGASVANQISGLQSACQLHVSATAQPEVTKTGRNEKLKHSYQAHHAWEEATVK